MSACLQFLVKSAITKENPAMLRNSFRLCNSLACRLQPCGGSIGLQHVRCLAQSVMSTGKGVESHYEVLGLPSSASQAQIRNAYLKLSNEELNRGALRSKEKYARLKEAYEVLSDSSMRNEHDQQLGLVVKGQKTGKIRSAAEEYEAKVLGGIYRKLSIEGSKRIKPKFEILPHITLGIMFFVVFIMSFK